MRTGYWPTLPTTGSKVLRRVRSSGVDGQRLEVEILELHSTEAPDGYVTDARRTSSADEREQAIARTQLIDVALVGPPKPHLDATARRA
jgi:hypothetical protein